MGRWKHQKEAFSRNEIYEVDGDWIGDAINKVEAAKLVDAHNADCDAYEKRIAELEAEQGRLRQIILDDGMELARVMAESLRVVECGEPCQPHELYPTQFVLRDNRVWVNDPGTRDIVDITNNNRVSMPYDESVIPVRLERWETEE